MKQYHILGEAGSISSNVELLDGIIVEKMPKSARHVFYTEELAAALKSVAKLGYVVREEKPITCLDSEPEPDVALVRGRRSDFGPNIPRRQNW